MHSEFFSGRLVRLAAQDPKEGGQIASRWGRSSEYWRLLTTDPAQLYSAKASEDWLEKTFHPNQNEIYNFGVLTLSEGKLIGTVDLEMVGFTSGDAFLGIGIGEPDYWGKGYGTDAMRLALRYAFHELNLYRVSLNVFDYNPRALRVYEKVGFRHEGRMRQAMRRAGRRYDLVFMGILRSEWEEGGR